MSSYASASDSRRPAAQKPASQTRQSLPDLTRKNHDQREHGVGQQRAQQPVQGGEFAGARKIECQRQRRHTHQHVGRARALDERQQFVNDDRDQQYVDDRNHRHLVATARKNFTC